jgi:hypothetical protein
VIAINWFMLLHLHTRIATDWNTTKRDPLTLLTEPSGTETLG